MTPSGDAGSALASGSLGTAHCPGRRKPADSAEMSELSPQDELVERPAAEVDESLIEWYLQLSVIERLRSASRSAAVLERLARAASANR